MIALDRKTGKVVWNRKFQDHKAGYTMTGAPTIVKDKKTGKVLLIHGSSGMNLAWWANFMPATPIPAKKSGCGRWWKGIIAA